ncbi:FAD:protein FMN transferase [Noviherbaspirillum sp. UKPF54]|uniref:FAD:protein FMN transferase n=1 Tax=Noviherbaspirillum sp. UKPF54 TaxID=2601898 RepID=UPI0011B1BCAE|nr:FAD:protein FMN transferase [Noviherbaspirillum sp. UKPF54]QDZ29312.1 FAD:protein FMN transferase [Noviherbaspirillum sp. UKPF54]
MQRRKFLSAGIGALAAGAFRSSRASAPGAFESGLELAPGRRLFRGADLAFGTTVTIQLVHDSERDARLAIEDAFCAARNIDRLLSIYRPGSQVYELNRTGSLLRPDPHLLTVLSESRRLAQLSGGAFDITVQPLWFAAAAGGDRRAALALVGGSLQFDRHQVRLPRAGMSITLNGIAQGYATDLALDALRARGIRDALVDIGEFSGIGRRTPQQPWRIGIQDPRHRDRLLGTMPLEARSLATSGDYETTFSADFSRHHIVDPASGESPPELASVTVAAPSAMLADGLSTALMVLGTERGLRLVRELPGVDALFVDKAGARRQSEGFQWTAT